MGTVHTVPCTTLHGIGANKVMVLGHLLLAEGDFIWADAVTVHTVPGTTLHGIGPTK